MSETLVKAEKVSKKFCRDLKRGLWYGVKDFGSELWGENGREKELREKEFWAVKDISFELKRGECLGLIGHNGAGKSTLLKMLNGLIKPDKGRIEMRGRVGALIELGAGFNPILTGRENIYINGSVLGFTKAEINNKLDAIIEFAEIGEFIDSAVQYYSSGMKVRLGFAVAAQMEPDVLIIDEVLAVGDLGFVLKCFNTIDNLLEKSAVIFVSHSMPMVSRICSDIILLEKGHSVFNGKEVSKGIDMYYSGFANMKKSNVTFNRNNEAELIEIKLGNNDNVSGIFGINRLDDLAINITLKVKSDFPNPAVSITVFDKEQRPIGICQNENGLNEKHIFKKEEGFLYYKVQLVMNKINLSKGIYSISFSVAEKFNIQPLLRLQSVEKFQVYSKNDVWPPIEFEGKWD